MLLSRSAIIIVLAALGLAFPHIISLARAQQLDAEQSRKGNAVQEAPPPSCPVTLPSKASFAPSNVPAANFGIGAEGRVSMYGTEKLWTLLPIDGIWLGEIPRKAGDFAYSNKLPWFRVHHAFSQADGPLTINGKRLDGPAPSFTATFGGFARNEDRAMIIAGVDIPVFGCWDIAGHSGDQELSFVVWVAPLPEQKSAGGAPERVQESQSSTGLRRIQVDGEVEARSLVYRVTPEIPHEAQVANISGTVVLHAIIADDGRARELRYISGPLLLTQAAIDAVRWWEYRVNDEGVEVETTIPVTFLASPTEIDQ